ncbi:general transcription factor 3C polypeptide 5 [Patella vulgata]|uniref:general transcription factor 3C polypeptide 5 n=1 Tax=Patella vulgata TaxID=6465 RepID=UPI00217FD074|nr:general transcription factor 3C polypeptide 5 [Patella vulgata]
MATENAEESGGKWMPGDKAITVDFNKFKKFVCIHHPAVVENVEKAFETVGGLKSLAKTCNNQAKRLELKWRPDDNYCKPAYGNRISKDCLVMKVRRRRRKRVGGGEEGIDDEDVQYKVEVLGMTDIFYEFKNLVDFQYLPTIQPADGPPYSILDKLKITNFIPQQDYLYREVPLFMPPVIMSRMDVPMEYMFRQNQFHKDSEKPTEPLDDNLIGTARRKRTIFTIFVGYNDPTPNGPMEGASTALHSKIKNLSEAKQIVQELFEKRPVWSKNGLRCHLDQKYLARLKFVLPLVSYFMTTGPWRSLWVKFGYDPRKDPAAKKYQTLDFRRKQRGAGDRMPIGHKRSSYSYSLPTTVNKPRSTIAQISTAHLDGSEVEKKEPSAFLESTYRFRPDVLPPYRQMFYQMCDIEDEKVQTLLNQNNNQETVCTEKEGWCIPDFYELARDILYQHVENIICKTSFPLPPDGTRRSRHVVAKMREIQLLEAASEDDGEGEEQGDDTGDGEGMEEDDENDTNSELMDCV